MDQLISAHEEFLESVIKRSLLDSKSENILGQMRLLLDHIIKFQSIQNDLFSKALEEQERRVRLERENQRRMKDGNWGSGEEDEAAEAARRQTFQKDTISVFKSKLMILYQTYQEMMNKFLLMLNSHSDDNLKFLSFRLDFNEFYKAKEPRIRTSLCFRQSLSSPTPATAQAASFPYSKGSSTHHSSMDRIHAIQADKRHQGLSSL